MSGEIYNGFGLALLRFVIQAKNLVLQSQVKPKRNRDFHAHVFPLAPALCICFEF